MGTCDFRGFTTLNCPSVPNRNPYQSALNTPWAKQIGNKPFRGVNLGGLFVLEPWITPNFTNWSLTVDDQYKYSAQNAAGSPGYKILADHWAKWYTPQDFQQMKSYGLNSVRIPTGWWYWAQDAGVPNPVYTVPTQAISDPNHPITAVIKMAKDAGLVVLLDLHGVPGSQNGLDNSGERSNDTNPARWGYHWMYDKTMLSQSTKILVSMAKYISTLKDMGIDNIIALELVNEPWVFGDMVIVRNFYVDTISAIRQVSKIPIVIHDAFRHAEWEWLLNNFPFQNVYMDTHLYHAFNADDIASSNVSCDKNKIIVAQNIACGYGSLLRFKTCTSVPTFVGEWSLANDDCINMIRGAQYSVQNKDYGQCKHLKERVNDPWWIEHYRDFFYKQAAMAERELGWFFWTWKLGPGSEDDPSTPYWSYSASVAAGIIPKTLHDSNITEACYEFLDTDPWKC
jgi:glucan 1,3-beta-glucosidase